MNDLLKYIFFVWCLGCHNATIEALIVGSNIAVSRENHITFPAADTNNRVRGFAWLEEGFTLEDNTTTFSFNSLFPVAGTVNLNGGTLILQTNLIVQDETVLGAFGSIEGQKHLIDFSPSVTFLRSSSSNDYWKNVHVNFSENVTISGSIKFLGNCFINGNGFDVTLDANTDLVVGAGAKLTLENLKLKDISGTKLRCLDDTAFIVLRSVIWRQDADYSFTRGYFKLRNVHMKGKRSGVKFIYQSPAQSEIKKRSKLVLDDSITFSYDPITVASKELLAFNGDSSFLVLQGATLHVTYTGLNLTKGTIVVEKDSTILAETRTYQRYDVTEDDTIVKVIDEGITFGDNTAANDVTCKIASGATLKLNQGTLNYKNVGSAAFVLEDDSSHLSIASYAKLNLYQTLASDKGSIVFNRGSRLGKASGVNLFAPIHAKGSFLKIKL